METSSEFVGARLTYARNRSGLSMQDIADLISVKRQYIHKVETAKENKSLSDTQISAIADRLGVDTSFFFAKPDAEISNDRLHFRSVAIPNYVRERAKIYTEDVVNVCLFIRDYIEPKGLEFPHFDLEEHFQEITISPKKEHKADIENMSLSVRDHLGLGRGPISNMVRVLEVSGVIVSTAKDVSAKVDAFCNDDVLPVVMRNDSKSSVRCRFDLAHELGHLIMHKGITNCVHENPLIEKQANHFASCFLLPKETFINEFPLFTRRRVPWDRLFDLKMRWKVSIAALIMRGHDLGLIDDSTRQKAFMHISRRGWRTCEPGDKEGQIGYIELEQPELISNAVNMLKNTYPDFLPDLRKSVMLKASTIMSILGMPDLQDSDFDPQKPILSIVK